MTEGPPFLTFTDAGGAPVLLELAPARPRVTIGRRRSCDVALPWDAEVSRLHAELVRMGADWVVCDDGLSRNGTFVNDARVRGRRRLAAGDVVRAGATPISFCAPDRSTTVGSTRAAGRRAPAVALSPAQQRVLAALCRPLLTTEYAAPASNRQIADELTITVETVKGTLSSLFDVFGLSSLAQYEKRSALALRALSTMR